MSKSNQIKSQRWNKGTHDVVSNFRLEIEDRGKSEENLTKNCRMKNVKMATEKLKLLLLLLLPDDEFRPKNESESYPRKETRKN